MQRTYDSSDSDEEYLFEDVKRDVNPVNTFLDTNPLEEALNLDEALNLEEALNLDEDDYEYAEDPQFVATFAQIGHTSFVGGVGGTNSRLFDILRHMDATESEKFMEQMSILYSAINKTQPFNPQDNPFLNLISKYPHPRFLNIPLCYIVAHYFNDKKHELTKETIGQSIKTYNDWIKKYKIIALKSIAVEPIPGIGKAERERIEKLNATLIQPHDILRYIYLFKLYDVI